MSDKQLAFLRDPHRYKILYGGRAGIKSWTIAQFLLKAGAERPLRIPRARETKQSIRPSVHQLLEDQITRLGLQAFLRDPEGRDHWAQWHELHVPWSARPERA